MITVPRSPNNDNSQTPQGSKPDEAMLLMALAHMAQIGRIKTASRTDPTDQLQLEKGDPVGSPATDKDFSEMDKANVDMGLRVRPDAAGEAGREYRRKSK
jgi:hypothetical protein